MTYITNASQNPRFETELSRRYGKVARTAACEIFEGLELPLPYTRDYLIGKESLQVFLRKHGLVLRFGQPSLAKVSDYVLQPLKTIVLSEKADFEMNPGIQVGGTSLCKIYLKTALLMQGEGLPRCEMVRGNIGSIRQTKPHSLVLDRCAVSPFMHAFNRNSGVDQKKSFEQRAPIQATHFKDFRDSVAQAFKPTGTVIDPDAKDVLFDLCAQNAALPDQHPDKKLFNDWVMPGLHRPRHVRIKAASDEYAARYA